MVRHLCLPAVVMALAFATSIRAQQASPAPPTIRAFDIPTLEALGLEIYRQDTAAWVGTDALRAVVPDLKAAHLRGWIVVPHGVDERVRFLRDAGQGLEAGYDIDVDSQRHGTVSEPSDRHLTPDEIAAFTARQTAAQNLPSVCRPGYNSVVAKDPQGDGWLVWMLAPMPALGDIPVGGHYRFTISHDGKTMVRRDALFASCIVVTPPKSQPAGFKPAEVVVSHVVSPTPVETHVFLQLQAHLPMLVLAGDRKWLIEDGHIRDAGTMSPELRP
jgi:hypothetical protein